MSNRPLVLVGIDSAASAGRTLDAAVSRARELGADVHAIRVGAVRPGRLDDRTRPPVVPAGDVSGLDRTARATSTSGTTEHDGVRVRHVTLRGEPDRVIPAYAQFHQATLLVVERDFGSSPFWRHGRVVDELARRSPVPMLVLPRQGHDTGAPRRILAPVDFSIASAVALRTAVDLSRRHDARVTVLHALRDVPQQMVFSGSEAWEVTRQLPAQAEAIAGRLRRKAAYFGAPEVETEVATGAAGDAIVETAARREADLVVMGVTDRSWLDRALFGSTLRRVLRRTTAPVLVVPVVAGAHVWPDEPSVGRSSRPAWPDAAAA